MKKLKLSQAEIDKLVVVERVDADPTVWGFGRNDVDFIISTDSGRAWQYDLWKTMLRRCFDHSLKLRQKTYIGVTCCEQWLSFATFLEWCNKELNYSGRPSGLQLDKDILIRGNSVYSPNSCCFVPQAVNLLLTDSAAIRGKWPVGVTKHSCSSGFQAALKCNSVRVRLGTFNTPQEAFQAYKTAKEAQIKLVANQYKSVLKPAVYEALMNWSITDESVDEGVDNGCEAS